MYANPDLKTYLPHMIYELIKTGAPHSQVLDFRRSWRLPGASRRQDLCPLCFRRGVEASLVLAKRGWFRDRLACAGCGHEFVVQRILD